MVPLCPVHKTPMVSSPDDQRRTEAHASCDNPHRHPMHKKVWSAEDVDKLLQQTKSLELALDFLPSDAPIAIISNTEDEDIKDYIIIALLERGRKKLWISEPGPRYQWVDKLDPNWTTKFMKAFKECAAAIYVRRPNSIPNKATTWELEALRELGKHIIVYEDDIQV